MTSILSYLGADHRRCDELLVGAEQAAADGDWSVAQDTLRAFVHAMEHHFAMEEEVLFPDFETRTGGVHGPTQVMRMEHGQMRDLFAALFLIGR